LIGCPRLISHCQVWLLQFPFFGFFETTFLVDLLTYRSEYGFFPKVGVDQSEGVIFQGGFQCGFAAHAAIFGLKVSPIIFLPYWWLNVIFS